ncbi:hypothetical protein DFH09DRAFT_1422304 [Mycena vulgaris]|nr:hypothetical protein DFH09DRAFT_1422304 [Mycena vulgaris]
MNPQVFIHLRGNGLSARPQLARRFLFHTLLYRLLCPRFRSSGPNRPTTRKPPPALNARSPLLHTTGESARPHAGGRARPPPPSAPCPFCAPTQPARVRARDVVDARADIFRRIACLSASLFRVCVPVPLRGDVASAAMNIIYNLGGIEVNCRRDSRKSIGYTRKHKGRGENGGKAKGEGGRAADGRTGEAVKGGRAGSGDKVEGESSRRGVGEREGRASERECASFALGGGGGDRMGCGKRRMQGLDWMVKGREGARESFHRKGKSATWRTNGEIFLLGQWRGPVRARRARKSGSARARRASRRSKPAPGMPCGRALTAHRRSRGGKAQRAASSPSGSTSWPSSELRGRHEAVRPGGLGRGGDESSEFLPEPPVECGGYSARGPITSCQRCGRRRRRRRRLETREESNRSPSAQPRSMPTNCVMYMLPLTPTDQLSRGRGPEKTRKRIAKIVEIFAAHDSLSLPLLLKQMTDVELQREPILAALNVGIAYASKPQRQRLFSDKRWSLHLSRVFGAGMPSDSRLSWV